MEQVKLPSSVTGQAEVNRLLRELNALDDFFIGAKLRRSGTKIVPPKITRLLSDLTAANGLNLLEAEARQTLVDGLKDILDKAPRMHISFAAEPPPAALERILTWLRANIHKSALLQVGLQPSIAAGCVLRTPNKVFDMSLRANLKIQEPYLVKLIVGAAHE